MRKLKFIFILMFLAVVVYAGVKSKPSDAYLQKQSVDFDYDDKKEPEKPKDRIEKIIIEEGKNFGDLMTESGFGYSEAMQIYDDCKDVYDLVNLRAGRDLEFVYDGETDEFREFVYQINTEEKLYVRPGDESWEAEINAIPYEVKTRHVKGEIDSSMYQFALDNDIDIRAIIELADAFQWTIDFAMDPRKGDTFEFVYEERYLDGEYVMPGQILAGKYNNAGKDYFVYYFEENEENKGFFDQDGNSVQKMFLKAPVSFKYISSGFTTGLRYVEAFNVSTGHRAIDYAAKLGTPIRAVGDGTVMLAGWNGGYGNMVKVRHNGTYSTNYGHMSRFAVSYGDKVKQGDIIGYVGSTGFSTGPHLHYEMVKNGVKINPLNEVLPPGEPIAKENQERFFEMVEKYREEFGI